MAAYLLLACQVVLAAIFLFAASGKILSSEQFLASLRLSHIPETFVMPLAVLTPIAEVILALTLLLSPPPILPYALASAFVLLSVFTVWMVWVSVRGLRLRCGCFGTGGTEIGRETIVRNALLIILAVSGFITATQTASPLPIPTLWMIITVSCVGLSLMLFQALRQTRSMLVLTMTDLEHLEREKLPPQEIAHPQSRS